MTTDPVKAIKNIINHFQGTEDQAEVIVSKGMGRVLIDLADSLSMGAITDLLDEFAPDLDAEVKASIQREYDKVRQMLNQGYDQQQILASYAAAPHSATAQAIAKENRNISNARTELEGKAAVLQDALLSKPKASTRVEKLMSKIT